MLEKQFLIGQRARRINWRVHRRHWRTFRVGCLRTSKAHKKFKDNLNIFKSPASHAPT
jgi:hypothetical protein